ncbi:hypothetical protein SERLA73DRAFT_190957 [Serpula lacrymans var. lacrymans S7.3]|uniref:Uncharacterized protein n=1 Tax=Serpula lacrymans var. lacrymans (strain S7.3) TaxID=936435 RepID=F8QGQ1_SERL3|nr:hypothetical protein SERLA73DRAFT_190957 [Serpula lacrymans var. lacrymans S7.3]
MTASDSAFRNCTICATYCPVYIMEVFRSLRDIQRYEPIQGPSCFPIWAPSLCYHHPLLHFSCLDCTVRSPRNDYFYVPNALAAFFDRRRNLHTLGC